MKLRRWNGRPGSRHSRDKPAVCETAASFLFGEGFVHPKQKPPWENKCLCFGCTAWKLFDEIWRRYGKAEATRIFLAIASPSKRQRSHQEDEMLFLLQTEWSNGIWSDDLQPPTELSIRQFSHFLALANEDIAKEGRVARGSTDKKTIRVQVNRMPKKRTKAAP